MTEFFNQKREILGQEDFKKYEYFAELLAYDIVKAEKGSEFLIVSGILDHRVYNHKDTVEAVKEALAKKVRFIVLAGPIVSVDNIDTNYIIKLWQEKKIELYASLYRQSLHYRISQRKYGKKIRAEDPCSITTPLSCRELALIKSDEENFWAEKMKNDFIACLNIKHALKADGNSFVFLSLNEIVKISNKAEKTGKNITFLSVDEIRRLYNKTLYNFKVIF